MQIKLLRKEELHFTIRIIEPGLFQEAVTDHMKICDFTRSLSNSNKIGKYSEKIGEIS